MVFLLELCSMPKPPVFHDPKKFSRLVVRFGRTVNSSVNVFKLSAWATAAFAAVPKPSG